MDILKILFEFILRNTSTVIDWLKNLADKQKRKFIKFDIAEFYPSISEDLLNKSIDYAKSFTTIGENDINAIKLARKSLLFSKDGTWVKKGGNELFHVTMGSFDGTEVCELVGLYLLDKLSKLLGKDIVGLYRDDNHKKSFRNRGYEHETELSKHIWKLKDNNTEFYLKWSIAAFASPYRCGTRRCDLCLTEKYIIARAEQKNLLNKRTELISICRHRNKYILKNL